MALVRQSQPFSSATARTGNSNLPMNSLLCKGYVFYVVFSLQLVTLLSGQNINALSFPMMFNTWRSSSSLSSRWFPCLLCQLQLLWFLNQCFFFLSRCSMCPGWTGWSRFSTVTRYHLFLHRAMNLLFYSCKILVSLSLGHLQGLLICCHFSNCLVLPRTCDHVSTEATPHSTHQSVLYMLIAAQQSLTDLSNDTQAGVTGITHRLRIESHTRNLQKA